MLKPGPLARSKVHRARVLAALVAASLACTTLPSQALAPALLMLGKQMLQDMVTSTAKSMLLDSLSGLGCKGIALSNAITSLDGIKRGGMGMPPGLAGMTGMPTMPTGMAGMPGLPGLPGPAGMPALPPGMAGMMGMPAGMAGMPGLPGLPGAAGMQPDMVAKMGRLIPAEALQGGGLNAEQSAMVAKMMGGGMGGMGGMGAPLSPLETIATLDEMSEIGMLPKAMNTELKECMVLLPQSAPMMGMAFGMMKPVLPKLREARDQMHALSPTEQDELAATLAQEFDKVPAADRKLMLSEIGGGMFPPRVVQSLTKRYGGK